jgi:hypothetical protein
MVLSVSQLVIELAVKLAAYSLQNVYGTVVQLDSKRCLS